MFPPMSTDGVLGAAFIPDDGYLDPSQLTLALADGARRLGAQIEVRTRVLESRRATGGCRRSRRTRAGSSARSSSMPPACTRARWRLSSASTCRSSRSGTSTSSPSRSIRRSSLPTLRDPDNLAYFRSEVGGLVMGGYAGKPASWAIDGIPDGFEAKLLPDEWERMEELFTNAIVRVPALENAEVKAFFNGPEAFTPDADFLLGETDVPGFWIAAGGCAHGLAGAGGVGKVMSEWIVDGRPEWDVWPLDWRRFGRQYRSREYTLARTYEALSEYYDIKYPGEERKAGRPLRVSPVYQRHIALDATFGEKSGWERVNWYESNAGGGDESLRPRGWAGENWSPAIEVEARAAREEVALFDQSSFSKIEVLGPGALAFLERLCGNRIDRSVGTIVYTQLLNQRAAGSRPTCRCCGAARIGSCSSPARRSGTHDRAWLERHLPRDGSVYVNDVTSEYACLCLWGPKAREVVSFGHGYMQAREVTVGNVPCIASRVTYVGELGWELYCPAEYGATLWDSLCADGVTPGGLPRDRVAAAREGLPRLGVRPHGRDDAVRSRPRLRREDGQGRLHRPRGARATDPTAEARVHRSRRSSRGCARLGARAGRRRDRRSRHEWRLRLRGRREHRVRVRPRLARGARHRGLDRHLRRLGRRRGPRGAALRPAGERIRG